MKQLLTVLTIFFILTGILQAENKGNKDPKELIEIMTEVTGNYEKLKSLQDVVYTYTVTDTSNGKSDISIEKYIFDGELSWAVYSKRENYVFPQVEGEVVHGYNGSDAWATINGKLVEDPEILKFTDFFRKTNFFWFAMMQKLLDPGINYSYEGKRNVNGIDYDIVIISYEQGVGDVSDKYLLYINPKTHLVDQFLFTVLDFNITEPYLMKVEYEEVYGVQLPARRKATTSNWNGDILGDVWLEEIMTEIKFNNGLNKSIFDKPSG